MHGKDPANRFQTADELRQVLNSYLSGRAVNISEPTRIIGAPGELGATKTRELSDQTRAMVRPVSGVSGQNTTRSAVSGSTGSYEVEKPKSNKNKIIAAVVAAVAVIGIVVAFATGLFGGEQVTVPDVLGKDQQTAVELIKEPASRLAPSIRATTTTSTRARSPSRRPTVTPRRPRAQR